MREYKTGTKWCFWRWKIIDSDYLKRLHVIQTPLFSVCVHWIMRPDAERDLHDHPVTFLSLILRGWYIEQRVFNARKNPPPIRKLREHFNFLTASLYDRHRIVACDPNTMTLCFMGPNQRMWGFHTLTGWVPWPAYYKKS